MTLAQRARQFRSRLAGRIASPPGDRIRAERGPYLSLAVAVADGIAQTARHKDAKGPAVETPIAVVVHPSAWDAVRADPRSAGSVQERDALFGRERERYFYGMPVALRDSQPTGDVDLRWRDGTSTRVESALVPAL